MHIYNRELSWLAFNDRVLQEACDKTVPLVQRLRFLGIFSSNQDEFLKVRVANLMRMNQITGIKHPKTVEGYPVKEILDKVHEKIDKSQELFTRVYKAILAEMEGHGIIVRNEKQLTEKQKHFCRNYFMTEVNPQLVPLLLRKSVKIPFLTDTTIYHAVRMSSRNSKNAKYAIIPIPVNSRCPRFVELPSSRGKKDIIFLDDIIRLCLDEIFFMFNYDKISAHTFKLLRDANLTVDDDISKSIIEKMEEGLEGRLHGDPVHLVYDREMPADLLEILTTKLKLRPANSKAGGRYHMMKHLTRFPRMGNGLEDENLPPLQHPDIPHFSGILSIIKKKDIFLNYPYHTFNHVIDMLREAAMDPKVGRIYMMLYRTAERSKIINILINAAENGKEVIVMEELMARFDEEQNIENSDRLQKAGIRVIHGFKGLKVHAKLIYIERKEKGHPAGYAYVGTGNFNEDTARQYGDFGLLTAYPQIAADVRSVFEFLVNPHKHITYKYLLVAPYFMRDKFEKLIEREVRNRQKGKEAMICAKFNSLTDVRMIRALYKASQAGVKVKLIIRGACCLEPGVSGQSENIRAISIVDKYLEHARTVIFHNGGEEQIYILSADWMTRNLDNRIEAAVPILDEEVRRTIKDVFDIQWRDNVKARDLAVLGRNNYVSASGRASCRSQLALHAYYESKAEGLV